MTWKIALKLKYLLFEDKDGKRYFNLKAEGQKK